MRRRLRFLSCILLLMLICGACNHPGNLSPTISPDQTFQGTQVPSPGETQKPTERPTEVPTQSIIPSVSPTQTWTPTLSPTSTPTPTPTLKPSSPLTPEQLLASMTLEEKVAQLFIVFPEDLRKSNSSVTAVSDEMRDFLRQYPVGGVILMGNNIVNPTQLTALTKDLQSASPISMWIAIDEEGGRVARIANNKNFSVPKYGSMREVGAQNDPALAKNVGRTIGTYLKQYGVNLNFAPVADVWSNPNNTAVGDRSFGSDPQMVASMVTSALQGYRESGTGSCIKHFPGHGDTDADTHNGFVAVTKSWSELADCELIPFRAAIQAGADMVMVAHLTTPNITTDGLPASLSYEMITERLRGELGFNGVVITDALNMGAITQHYGADVGALTAFKAGADILLMPKDFIKAYNAVLEAVRSGEVQESRLNESVLRILSMKKAYGII